MVTAARDTRAFFVRLVAALLLALVTAVAVPVAAGTAAPAEAAPQETVVALPSVGDVLDVVSPIPGIVKNPTDPKAWACALPPISVACSMTKAATLAGEEITNRLKGTLFEKIVQDMGDGFQRMLMWSLSWWIKIPSPKLTDAGMTELIQKIYDYTFYIQLLGLATSIMFVGFRMMLTNRGWIEESEDLFKTMGRAIFGTAILGGILAVATKGSDALSNWLLSSAIGGADGGQLIKNIVKIDLLSGHLGWSVLGLVLLFGIIGAFVQMILLVIRQAMLIVVVSAIPIAAASSGTGIGSSAYDKMLAWIIAFLLFKPVGALVYMIAFTIARGKVDNPYLALLGVILLSLVCLVMPALMRLIVPAVGSMGAAMGGGIVGGMLGAGMSAAANKAAGGSGGSGSSGGGGASPLSGRSGGGPQGPPPGPPSGGSAAGKHAAIGAGKSAAGAGAGAAGAGAAAGPVGAAVGAVVSTAGKAKDAVQGAASGEADGGAPNPTGGSNSPARPSTQVPTLASGTGEHRMAA